MSEIFSYSRINTFKNCRELYHINYIQGIRKENENIEAYLGSCVHHVIEDIYENNNQIMFIVKDNGIGIDENKISKYFEPYFTTKDKGTGLGLSIVKKIIEDHGGIIRIEKNKNMAGTATVILFDIQ